MKRLSRREEQFAQHFALYGNATAAAIAAGYSKKSAKVRASRLRTRPEINAAIDRYAAKKQEQTQTTAEKVLAELAKIAFSKLPKAVNLQAKLKALELLGKICKLFDASSDPSETAGQLEALSQFLPQFFAYLQRQANSRATDGPSGAQRDPGTTYPPGTLVLAGADDARPVAGRTTPARS